MSIIEEVYESKKSEISAKLFTLTSRHGLVAKVTNYGGIIVSMEVPDRNGVNADIALGKDSLDDYLEGNPYFGTITGRVAGRIGGGRFTLEGRNYILAQNDEPNCLHGGEKGFDKILWEASITGDGEKEKLQLTTVDPAGHNNFPGTVRCTVTYGWIEDNSFEITYKAKTDHTTPLNLTNHSYFNLAGHDSGDVLGHEVQIHSDAVAAVDENATLIGKRMPVRANYNDYRRAVCLGDLETLEMGNADIHFFLYGGRTVEPKLGATVYEPNSGRIMEVHTTEPGVQFYSGIALSIDGPESGKGGCTYPALGGLCLETQDYADCVNFPGMGGAILRPDEVFTSTTLYKFRTRG